MNTGTLKTWTLEELLAHLADVQSILAGCHHVGATRERIKPQKNVYQKRLRAGLCTKCGEKPRLGNRLCEPCIEREKVRNKKYRSKGR